MDISNNEYLEIFNIFDTNKDGSISIQEFNQILNRFGIFRSKDEIVEMIKIVDKDNNKSIDLNEIIEFIRCGKSYKNEMEDAICDAFYIFDKEKKGFITLNNLLFYIRKIGLNLPYSLIIEEFNLEDKDGNGKINFNEFRYMIIRENRITNFKIIADLLILVDKIEIKSSLNSIYPISEEIHQISLFLKKFYIFEKLPRGRLYKISKNVIIKDYSYREKVCCENTLLKFLYIIFSGEISEEIKTISFNISKKTKGCGYIIGLEELRDKKKKYNFSYYPKTTSIIYKIPIDVIKKMMDIDNVFCYRINSFINYLSDTYYIKLPRINIKKNCSYSNLGKRYDYTMGQNQVLSRIKFLKNMKKIKY